LFLGIDIGGTSIRVSAFRSLDRVDAFDEEVHRVTGSYDQDFVNLGGACKFFQNHHGEPIEGIGLAIAGVLDRGRTTLAKAGNTRQWVGQPFVQKLGEHFNCRVAFGNDAEAAALAEAMYSNPDGEDFWFVIWGTGVGGTLVRYINGSPVAFAGEMGHQQVSESQARICACNQIGCLEAYCGGAKIHEYEDVPAEELSPAQWNRVLSYMVIGLHNIVTIQPVLKVYFGGGIAAKQAQFIPQLEQTLRDELHIVEAPSMELSRFGESAGTVGALALLRSVLA
jgi:predicted NBD/HSP70 family sugar kinase